MPGPFGFPRNHSLSSGAPKRSTSAATLRQCLPKEGAQKGTSIKEKKEQWTYQRANKLLTTNMEQE
eukprot:1156286-Pelagomonas_calceolata.AAC.4